MLFVAIAKDGIDEGASARRLAVRAEHLERVMPHVEAGLVLLGGALLNEAGGMVGSLMLLEAASEGEARAFLESDIYSRAGVWQQFEIYPFRLALQSKKLREGF